ncbi:hypothetical protein V500_10251, partial [Pseudogymnoascus sp. VKM F-4518 (FW-2643)]
DGGGEGPGGCLAVVEVLAVHFGVLCDAALARFAGHEGAAHGAGDDAGGGDEDGGGEDDVGAPGHVGDEEEDVDEEGEEGEDEGED